MSEANLPLNQPITGGLQTSTKPPKVKRDNFTKLQSFLLIFLTLVISIGGWYGVGKYYFWTDIDMKRVNSQLDYLKQKIQSEPNNASTRVELGYTYSLKGDEEAAVKEFNQAILIDSKNFDAYYNLGIVLNKQNRYNEALQQLQKAVELSPRDYKVHVQRGIAYRGLKMYKEASDSLSQANKLMPGNADIIYEIGRVAEEQGQFDDAQAIYKEALSYDPLFKDAITALDRVTKK